jgi:aquaporin Z
MAYAIGHISVYHLSPTRAVGLWAGERLPPEDVVPYLIAQIVRPVIRAAILNLIASIKAGFDPTPGFAANGYAQHSPGGYSLVAALVYEVAMTIMFLVVILGATDERAPPGMTPLAIGLCLTLVYLIRIPVRSTSVHPARSTSSVLLAASGALEQLWLFWLAPIVGAIVAGVAYRAMFAAGKPAADLTDMACPGHGRQASSVFSTATVASSCARGDHRNSQPGFKDVIRRGSSTVRFT